MANVQIERMNPDPIAVQRTRRVLDLRQLTSVPAGKMTPIAYWPLLREDALAATRLAFSWEMMETVELIVNPINVHIEAWLVPHLALDRFFGMDDLNRSYMKQPPKPSGSLVPFFEMQAFNAGLTGSDATAGINSVYKYLGLHGKDTDQVNTNILESYNQIWNFKAKNRSPDLTLRARLATHLAPAFWYHEQFSMVVPDFQQAIIEGEVALNVVQSKMPVKGLGLSTAVTQPSTLYQRKESTGTTSASEPGWLVQDAAATSAAGLHKMIVKQHPTTAGYPDVWAEMQENGITVSLSNIEMARKTQAFALLRQQYKQLPEEWIIDLLMSGVRIPDQALMQPILLGQANTVFGMSKRYASDADNLTKSVVNGLTELEMMITTPRINTGGVVMLVAEVTPTQLWEHQRDMYFHCADQDTLPEYLRDTLDPEKVEVVLNKHIDAMHSTPDGVFGYAPMSWRWAQKPPAIGGKFYKRSTETTADEARQRIWAVETTDPTLSESFYVCTNMHTKPFVDTVGDSFEVTTAGTVAITGNTVFGPQLVEGSGDYEAIMAEAPTDRIDKVATTEASAKALPSAASTK